MASVHCDAHSILFIDYFETGETINSKYFMALLDELSEETKKKTASNAKEKSAGSR